MKLTGNWKGLTALLDKRTTKSVDDAVLRASAAEIKGAIVKGFGELASNAKLTIALKGRDDPGRDTEDLISSIKVIFLPMRRGLWIGIEASSAAAAYAQIVAEGAQIEVSDAMREMFFLLWQVSEGKRDPAILTGSAADLWNRMPGGWLPLKPETTHIIIPPRPWIRNALAKLQSSGKLTAVQQAATAKALRSRYRGAR